MNTVLTDAPAAPTSDLPVAEIPSSPSTAGMTTKVVKGSLWTMVGQVGPLAISLVTTPFVIRMLGAESYGVLVLLSLIPAYLGFADFGMGLASTKFASEAYADGDLEREARIVRTAALIAFCSSMPFAILLVGFSPQVISLFNVPEHLHAEASLALEFAAVTFVINFLNGIFNTPQLTRLRMDLNTLVSAGFRITGLVAMPIAIYVDGLVGAVFVLMVASCLTLLGHLIVSRRLEPYLFDFTIERSVIRPMVKFGGAYAIGGIASVLLMNLEKATLAKLASVQTLAYYSVAFMLASTANMFSSAMVVSLVPAFSQLLNVQNRAYLNNLFGRALRLNVIVVLPLLTTMIVFSRPFFTLWAGSDFGNESTWPFYTLTVGLLFNLVAYVPAGLLMASGRTDLLAKIYWLELFPYLGLVALLTIKFGIVGTAAAWSIRNFVDAAVIALYARKSIGVSYDITGGRLYIMAAAIGIVGLPVIVTFMSRGFTILSPILLILCLAGYALITWKVFLTLDEKSLIRDKTSRYIRVPIIISK